MTKKPDYLLEYVYRKNSFKKTMWIYLAVWAALRITRAIIILTVGAAWLASAPLVIIFWASGVVCGLAIATYYVYRHSVRIHDIEREQDNMKKITLKKR